MKALNKVIDFLLQFPDMTSATKIYVYGFILFFASWFVGIVFRSGDLLLGLSYFSGFCFVLGFAIELIQYISSIWETKFAKFLTALLGLFSVILWWASKTLASQFLNYLIPANPAYFSLASQAFTFMIVILLWLIITFLFFMIMSILLMLYTVISPYKSSLAFHTLANAQSKDNNSTKTTSLKQTKDFHLLGRVLGSFVIAFLVWSLIGIPVTHRNEAVVYASTVIAWTDYYTFSNCSNHNFTNGERVAFLSDKDISVAIPNTPGGYTFETRVCEP